MMLEEVGNDHIPIFINNTTISRVEVGADGKLYRLSISSGKEYLSKDKLYTKADIVTMLKDLKEDVDIMSDTVVEDKTVTITSWLGMQKRIIKLIQSKIDKLEER